MRIDVKLPGPAPTDDAPSSSARPTPAVAQERVASASTERGARARSPSSVAVAQRALVATAWRCQRRGSVTPRASRFGRRLVDDDSRVTRTRAHARRPAAGVLRPLDERDRPFEVGLEVAPLLRVEPVRGGRGRGARPATPAVVAVADRERRARDRPGHAERARRRRGRRSSSRRRARPRRRRRRPAEAARASSRRERLRLLRRRRGHLHRPTVPGAPQNRPSCSGSGCGLRARRGHGLGGAPATAPRRAPEQLGNAREVLLEHAEHARRVERRRRVEDRVEHDRAARRASPPAPGRGRG